MALSSDGRTKVNRAFVFTDNFCSSHDSSEHMPQQNIATQPGLLSVLLSAWKAWDLGANQLKQKEALVLLVITVEQTPQNSAAYNNDNKSAV